MLSQEEQIYFYLLALISIGIPILNWIKPGKIYFWSPMTMVSLVFIYYAVVGPYFAVLNDNTYYKLVEHRPYLLPAWQFSLLAFLCMLLGFQVVRVPKPAATIVPHQQDINYSSFGKILVIITIIGIIGLVGTGGLVGQLDVFNPSAGTSLLGGQGAFRNYLMHSINLLVGASCFYLVAMMDKKTKVMWFSLVFIFAMAVFTKQGYRWRHVMLGMSLLATFYLIRDKRVNLLAFGSLAVVGLIFMGFIESTRSYGAGLRIDEENVATNEVYLERSLGESSVFMTTGLLIASVTLEDDYIGWDPVVQTLVMPIPRQLWPDKPSGDYIEKIMDLYSYEHDLAGTGASILNFGEYYLMFGLLGVILGCFLLGIIFKLVWRWFLLNHENPLAVITYAVFFSYIYVILSRGYLPQVVMLFMFTVFPLFWIYRRQRTKYFR